MSASNLFIPADKVPALLKEHNVDSPQDLLPILMKAAMKLAIPPISRFHVGAAALGVSGAIYLGVNVEFPGQQLNQSIHGEQCIISNAARLGETALVELCVNAAPCGHCRQFMTELPGLSTYKVRIYQTDGENLVQDKRFTVEELLPSYFGPKELGKESEFGMFVAQDKSRTTYQLGDLCVGGTQEASDKKRKKDHVVSDEDKAAARAEACVAASNSYAPYSACYAGVSCVYVDDDGAQQRLSASYYESAAYNPSLAPFQCLIVALTDELAILPKLSVDERLSMIADRLLYVCVVQTSEKHVNHWKYTQTLLEAIGAEADMEGYLCHPAK